MKNPAALLLTTFIFIGCLCIGFWDARHKVLWNDEFYSQLSSIHNTSYAEQFAGAIPEGGNSPLFYSLQKALLQLIHYQIPTQWLQGQWNGDPASEILLRINPVICMSLSIVLIFYYFCRSDSLGIGFYSLFIYFSSYMLWAYWAEARPYALLVFLTTVQSVIFLKMLDQNPPAKRDQLWIMLAVANVLLSLTSIFSLGEILAVSVWWWVLKERDWKKYIMVTLLPTLIVLFYYMHAPKYHFFFGSLSPEQLIRDNISRERFDFLFLFLILLASYWWGRQQLKAKFIPGADILKALPYVVFMALVLASSSVVLCIFYTHAIPGKGFPITSRYFIYLTPIGVIATTILTVSLIKSLSKYPLVKWPFIGLIGILLVQHFLKIVPKAIHSIITG